jgi:hypothetical protein
VVAFAFGLWSSALTLATLSKAKNQRPKAKVKDPICKNSRNLGYTLASSPGLVRLALSHKQTKIVQELLNNSVLWSESDIYIRP